MLLVVTTQMLTPVLLWFCPELHHFSPRESLVQPVLHLLRQNRQAFWFRTQIHQSNQNLPLFFFFKKRKPSRRTGPRRTQTVLLFSVAWLRAVKGSGVFCVFPEWTSAEGAPSARSKRFPVATSARQERKIKALTRRT